MAPNGMIHGYRRYYSQTSEKSDRLENESDKAFLEKYNQVDCKITLVSKIEWDSLSFDSSLFRTLADREINSQALKIRNQLDDLQRLLGLKPSYWSWYSFRLYWLSFVKSPKEFLLRLFNENFSLQNSWSIIFLVNNLVFLYFQLRSLIG